MKSPQTKRRIFLDHASTTPVHPRVLKAMEPFGREKFHNPSALYKEGVEVSNILFDARKKVARLIFANPDEVVFTGSGTEADNLAILGVVKVSLKIFSKPHVIISAIEHPAILELQDELKSLGASVTVVLPNEEGIVEVQAVAKALRPQTVLVSVMYANNETGVIMPIAEIAKTIRHFKKTQNLKTKNSKLTTSSYPYFHTDASQAPNYLDISVNRLNVDLMTLDGSKIYGPKGVGMLFYRRGLNISPIIFGGGQEKGLRSGTENLSGIVGFTEALSLAIKDREKESKRLANLRDKLIKTILKNFKEAELNGNLVGRLPNNINICFKGIDGEFAVIKADALGIMCSTASSCRTRSENAYSYVLRAMGKGKDCSESSLRFTLGRETKSKDINYLLKVLPKIINSAKRS